MPEVIVVVGGIATDFLVTGARLPTEGESVVGRELLVTPGGKGLVQAVACARLGARVQLVGKLGADARGDEILTLLRREGVGTDFVFRDSITRTGGTVIMVDKTGAKQTLSAPGANHRLRPSEVRRATSLFRSAKAILVQLEIPIKAAYAAIEIGMGCNAKVILDPAPAVPFPNSIFRMVDLVKPNRHEAEVITGYPTHDRSATRLAGERLLWLGAQAALIQSGDGGSLLLENEREHWFPDFPVETVDTTGAGDALAAGIAAEWSRGIALADAVLFGSAAAALACTRLGAVTSLPTRSEVESLIRGPSRERAA